jgi:hypothetical protein
MHLGLGDAGAAFRDGLFRELPEGPADDALGLFGAGLVGGQAGDREDDPAVALLGRADEAVARLGGVAGLQPVGADAESRSGLRLKRLSGERPL